MKITPRLIPRNDPEANVIAYMHREQSLKRVLGTFAKRNVRDAMRNVTDILTRAGYDGTNRNTVMLKQADPKTIKSLEELAERLPDDRRKNLLSKVYGSVGTGSLTVRKAITSVIKNGVLADTDKLFENAKDVLRETAKEGMYRGEFMIQKSVGVGWTMETPGLREVDAFVNDKWTKQEATHYMRPMSDALKDEIEEALLLGESPQKMAKRIERVEEISDIRAKRNARTITTAVANSAQMGQYEKDGITEYRWVATFDERTCPACGALDGRTFKVGKGEYPPLHPNCRCTTEAVLDKEDEDDISAILEAHKNDPRAKYIPKGMTVEQWQKDHVVEPKPKTPKPDKPTKKQSRVAEMRPASIGPVKRDNPMSVIDAWGQPVDASGKPTNETTMYRQNAVNPKFSEDRSYRINCQTCNAVDELRLRGYDCTAKGFDDSRQNQRELSHSPRKAWLDPTYNPEKNTVIEDGKEVDAGTYGKYVKTKVLDSSTTDKMYAEMDTIVKEGERYGFYFNWKGCNYGHIVTLGKDAQGLYIFDSQCAKMYRGEALKILQLDRIKKSKLATWRPTIFRKDNAIPNVEMMENLIDAGGKK